MIWYVYMLRCRGGSLYTGYTNDLVKRLKRHRSGKGAKYTRSRLPVEMVWSCPFPTKSAAMKNEAALKKMKRKEKLSFLKADEMGRYFVNPPYVSGSLPM